MFNIFKKSKNATDQVTNDEKPSEPVTTVVPTSESLTATIEPSKEVVDIAIKKEHVCDENCKHDQEEKQEIPPLTQRELKYLKRAKYDEIAGKFKKAFVLKNRRTGQIAEIRAASAFHACNILGWKPNRAALIETKIIEDEKKNEPDTVSQAEVKA
jgi:hypothetical protein